jgi:hypothetical protein
VNIGIIVYSHTGHTLSVATRLQEKLAAAGHQVTLEQLETVGPLKMSDTAAELRARPAIGAYDALVLACPVRGGMPAPPMRVYLEGIVSLEGKDVVCLVTGVAPFSLGRKQTLAQMKGMCESKGATVRCAASVWWLSLRRRRQISTAVDQLVTAFTKEY